MCNLVIFAAICSLSNATYSMLCYRRHIQLYSPELMEDLSLPLDLQVEAFAGMILGIMAAIFKYTSSLSRIKLQQVLSE